MNDSFTSASMRRETMRSRLFGAVMMRGLREGCSCGRQRWKYTWPGRGQQPCRRHLIPSAATTYGRGSAGSSVVIIGRLVGLLGLLRLARGPLRILPRDRLALGAQTLVPFARCL